MPGPLASMTRPKLTFGWADTPGQNEMRRFCVNRHNGGLNGIFLDFSTVRKIGLKELWRLKWHRRYDLNADGPDWPAWMSKFPDY